MNGFLTSQGSAEQRRRSRLLFEQLCQNAALEASLRDAALEHLAAIDRPAAVKVARRLVAELGRAARRPTTAPASAPASRSALESLRERVESLLEKPR